MDSPFAVDCREKDLVCPVALGLNLNDSTSIRGPMSYCERLGLYLCPSNHSMLMGSVQPFLSLNSNCWVLRMPCGTPSYILVLDGLLRELCNDK